DPSNKNKKFSALSIGLSAEEEKVFSETLKQTLSNQGKEISDFYKKSLSEYQTYAQRRIEIQEKFQKAEQALVAIGAPKESFDEAKEQRDKILSDLDREIAGRNELFNSWISQITSMGIDELRRALREAERQLVMMQVSAPSKEGKLVDTKEVAILR